MIKIYLTLIVLFSVICRAQEQNIDTIQRQHISNEYIEKYDDFVKLRLGLSNSFNSFHLKDDRNSLDFTLSPNQRLRTTLTFIYKFIEFDLGYTPDFMRFNKDDASKGNTKFFNFGTRLYLGHWVQNLQYSKTKGFYVDKDDIGSTENVLFPDFEVTKIGGNTSYVFNPNFSLRAIFLQSEWQKKSAGSFVPSISYYFTKIRDGEPGTDNIIDVAIGPAYYYNWVLHKKLLISGGAYGGIGYNSTKTIYDDNTLNEKIDGLSFESQLRFTVGYNSDSFYAGAVTSLNSFYYNADPKTHVRDQQQFFEIYIAYRFKGPDKVNKFLDNPLKSVKKAK